MASGTTPTAAAAKSGANSVQAAARRLRRGLTLLELMAALAVLAVLLALGLPSMGAMLQRHRLTATAQVLSADLVQARFEAARLGQTMQVQATGGAAWCWAVSLTSECDCAQTHTAPQPACRIKAERAAEHAGVRLLEPFRVQFNPQGGSGSTAATFESPSGDRLRVELSAMGRPRLCVPTTSERPQTAAYPRC